MLLQPFAAVAWLATTISALAIPSADAVRLKLWTVPGSDEVAVSSPKRRRPNQSPFTLPSPSRVCAAGANEDDPAQTIFVSPENSELETARWTPREGNLLSEQVDILEAHLMALPDNYVTYVPPDTFPHIWQAPGGNLRLTLWADATLPIIATRLVLSNWINFIGNHRQQHDTSPAGMIELPNGITLTLEPADPQDDGIEPDDETSDDDSDWEGSDISENPEGEWRLQESNNSGFPFRWMENRTPSDYFDAPGQCGGMPTYRWQSKHRRRTFGLLRDIWNRLFGHHDAVKLPPYTAICGCQRVMKVVDLESEVQRLQLADLDLMSYASDDPREHQQMDQYLGKLQGLSASASSGEKAHAIASLLRLSDSPPDYIVKDLVGEIDACGSNSTLTKRKNPTGLANERWEDDRWNHQLSERDVRELLADLRRNGLARVKADFQSFRFGNAYVSWSSKFSDQHFAPPSREEILPYVRMFLQRVSWGENEGGQWWKPWKPSYWSTSYRDIVFGQKTMRLCISNRPKRCLK